MRAIVVRRFGGPEVLESVRIPAPEPGPGRVAVRVSAIGVGWMDTQIRAGLAGEIFPVAVPYTPGWAVAGTVAALGAGVDGGWLGAPVVTRATGGYGGGYAETVIADIGADSIFRLPAGVGPDAAVALIDDGSTALALLERTPVGPGDRVLVTPGLGGLGHLAVQLARDTGAYVIAAVRGSDKRARAAALADTAVDYADPTWPARVRALTGGRGLDVVFDGIGGATGATAADLLVDGGRFSGYGMTSGAQTAVTDATARGLTVVDMAQLPDFHSDTPRRVRAVLALAASGDLTPIIGRTYPLEHAADAHTDIEHRRSTGKILLRP